MVRVLLSISKLAPELPIPFLMVVMILAPVLVLRLELVLRGGQRLMAELGWPPVGRRHPVGSLRRLRGGAVRVRGAGRDHVSQGLPVALFRPHPGGQQPEHEGFLPQGGQEGWVAETVSVPVRLAWDLDAHPAPAVVSGQVQASPHLRVALEKT